MKFFEKTKGAVSIFLVIILLPTMTLGGVMMDVGRTNLASEVAMTSADLALNTVLSAYDENLKNYYGLFASCQNTDEIIRTAKQYFVDSMVSCGIDTSIAGGYVDNVMDAFLGDEDIRDMLQISVKNEANITKNENGAMNNPALIKEGIIEFMKYRAPVNGVASLFDGIINSGVAEQLENTSYETTMVEKRREFYKKEEELYDLAKAAYDAINKYEDYKTHTGKKISDEDFLNQFEEYLNHPHGTDENLEDLYKKAHIILVKDLYNTHNNSGNMSFNLMKTKGITNPGTIKTYSDKTRASETKIKTLINSLNTAMKTYYSRATTLTNAWNNMTAYNKNSDYALQYWVQLTKKCQTAYSNYVTAASNYWLAANKLKNAVAYAKEDALESTMNKPTNSYVSFPSPEEGKSKLTLQQVADTLLDKFDAEASTVKYGNNAYKKINSQINAVKSSESLAKSSRVNFVYEIRNKLHPYLEDFEKAAKLAKDAKKKVDALKAKLVEYKNAYVAWEKAAMVPQLNGNEVAEEDRKLIEELKGNVEKFSETSATHLAGRLDNINTLFTTLKKGLESIKYFSTSIMDIYDFKTFRRAASLDANKIVRNASSLDSYANSSFSFKDDGRILRVIITDGKTSTTLEEPGQYHITDSFKADLGVVAGNLSQAKELYDWLMDTFPNKKGETLTKDKHGFDVSDEDSADDAGDEIDGKADSETPKKEEKDTKGKNMSEYSGAALPSGEFKVENQDFTADLKEVASFATKIFSNFTDTFTDSLVAMRDDLFALDYMKSMFTHDTFDYEGYYKHLSDDVKKKITDKNATQYYNAEVKKAWQDDDDRKTLKLVDRDAKHNWAYCGELEYLLYGSGSNVDNKNTAYGKIYLIRMALDIAPVFKANYDNKILHALAMSLQTFAYIPAVLTKTLVCIAITAAEAAKDIAYLKKGIPVPLIKSDEDVFCSFESVIKGGSDNTPGVSDRFSMQYSDYLTVFMYLELLTADENVMYSRTGDLIQANISLVTGVDGFALSKAQVVYNLNATITIEPMWSNLLAIDEVGDLSTSEGWRTVEINMNRAY